MRNLLVGAAVAMTVAGAAADVQAQPWRDGGGWDHGRHEGWDRGRGNWHHGYRGDYGRRAYYGDYYYRRPVVRYRYVYPTYPYAFYLNIGPTYRRHHRRHWECWYTRHGREICDWVRW